MKLWAVVMAVSIELVFPGMALRTRAYLFWDRISDESVVLVE